MAPNGGSRGLVYRPDVLPMETNVLLMAAKETSIANQQ